MVQLAKDQKTKTTPLNRHDIENLLHQLGDSLKKEGKEAELFLVGGAVMCLVYNSRESTRDLDGVFEPKNVLYSHAKQVAIKNDIQEDWLNDGVKGFLSSSAEFKYYKKFGTLAVHVADPKYLLAMKCFAARTEVGSSDLDDMKFLLKHLKLKSTDQAIDIVGKYYSPERIPMRAKYMLEEALSS